MPDWSHPSLLADMGQAGVAPSRSLARPGLRASVSSDRRGKDCLIRLRSDARIAPGPGCAEPGAGARRTTHEMVTVTVADVLVR